MKRRILSEEQVQEIVDNNDMDMLDIHPDGRVFLKDREVGKSAIMTFRRPELIEGGEY